MVQAKEVPRTLRAGAAAEFVDARLAAGRVAFSLAELVGGKSLSVVAATNQLRRLGPRVARVSRPQQFFLIVSPEHRSVGAPPAEWWLDDYFNWLRHPYYLALQSAAGAHGSNPQAIQVTQVMTDVPRRMIQAGRLRVYFFVKSGIEQTPTQPLANAFAPCRVSTPAATAFDLVRYAPRIGGIGRAIETLVPLLPRIRISDLKLVLEAANETASAQRLGYVVEKAGKEKLAEAIHAWLPSRLALVPLNASKAKPANAPLIERWHLFDNSGELGA